MVVVVGYWSVSLSYCIGAGIDAAIGPIDAAIEPIILGICTRLVLIP